MASSEALDMVLEVISGEALRPPALVAAAAARPPLSLAVWASTVTNPGASPEKAQEHKHGRLRGLREKSV